MTENACCYHSCTNSRHKIKGLRMFRFSKAMCQEWIQNCGNPDLVGLTSTTLYNKKRICQEHFLIDDILPSGRLMHGTVPIPYEPARENANITNAPDSEDDTQSSLLSVKRTSLPPKIYSRQFSSRNFTSTPDTSTAYTDRISEQKTVGKDKDNVVKSSRLQGHEHAQISEELPSTSSQSCSTDILFDHGEGQEHSSDNESSRSPCKIRKEESLPELKQEELILDYDELNYNDESRESMEYEASTEYDFESSNYLKNVKSNTTEITQEIGSPFETVFCDDNKVEESSRTTEIKQEVVESQFETVFCEESTVKIKQEIEDEDNLVEEPDNNSLSNTIRPFAPIASLLSQPSTSKVEPCRTKSVTRTIQKSRRSQKPSFIRCELCVNEFFSNVEDLKKHCIQKHSVVSINSDGASKSSIITSQGRVEHSQSLAVSLGTNPPNKPPGKSSVTSCDLLEGVFVSLKNIPLERREAAKDKIMELVGLIAKENVHPSLVQISLL